MRLPGALLAFALLAVVAPAIEGCSSQVTVGTLSSSIENGQANGPIDDCSGVACGEECQVCPRGASAGCSGGDTTGVCDGFGFCVALSTRFSCESRRPPREACDARSCGEPCAVCVKEVAGRCAVKRKGECDFKGRCSLIPVECIKEGAASPSPPDPGQCTTLRCGAPCVECLSKDCSSLSNGYCDGNGACVSTVPTCQ